MEGGPGESEGEGERGLGVHAVVVESPAAEMNKARAVRAWGEVPLWERLGGGTLGSSPTRASPLARRTGRGDGAGTSGGGEEGGTHLLSSYSAGFQGKARVSFGAWGRGCRAGRKTRCVPLPSR